MIARVAVEKTSFSRDMLYSYLIPSSMLSKICVGSRVIVPFGKCNSMRKSFVVDILAGDEIENAAINLKNICSVIDQTPLIDKASVNFALWISSYYFCALYESLTLILPSYVKDDELNIEAQKIYVSEIFLSDYQRSVYEDILSWFSNPEKNEALLYGITGSGKTKLFLKLSQEAILNKKKILILVPEISLIPQMLSNIEEFFGKDSYAYLHSGLTTKKRATEWKKIKKNLVQIVVGTRSAVFAPFIPDLIIIDEEQESTYKSDKSPRYNTNDIARFLCRKYNSKLLLSSATPSIESFYLAKSGKIELFELKKRYGNAIIPEVKIVNMNKKDLYNARSILSLELIESLCKSLSEGNQSILLLDRRGFHVLARCSSCGKIIKCKNCSTSLTHHKIGNIDKLACHYCGFLKVFTKICSECGQAKVNLFGVGTQSIEEELKKAIPNSSCIRVDADTIKSKKMYEKIFNDFREQKYNIMIGTRMVAKGLDFKNVNLVGILYADQSLFNEGYKSYEHTFSLISQAIGRSGRHDSHGKALIQSFSADNPIVEIAARQDYDLFFEKEIYIRKLMLYPPFADICTVGFTGSNEEKTWEVCLFFYECLKFVAKSYFSDIPLKILSPSKAFLYKISNKFRFRIIIKCRNNREFRSFLKESLKNYEKKTEIDSFKICQKNKNGVSIFFDMNAENCF